MSEKQAQQHSQHFNLSGEAKQKLEQLTARRYPGKKRRQSQLVEDLITQAFAKEYAMSSSTTARQEPDPDWLAPLTLEALSLARQAALRFKAATVISEHLLLGLVEQSEKGVLNILAASHMDGAIMRRHLERLLSSEQIVEEQPPMRRRREELFAELKPGQIRRGIVTQLANFGAFVDLGGVQGLVHVSQLSWSRVNHPGEVLHIGQEVEVQILSIDKEKQKVALSIKHAEVDPWTTAEQRYAPGQLVTGIVTKIAPFGAFVHIEDGIEGLIHLTQLPPGIDPASVLYEGAQVPLRILHIDAERHRLSLGMHQSGDADTPLETPFIEPDVQYGALAAPDVEPARGGPPLSSEAREVVQGSLLIAQRMHSPLVQPEHLLLSILQHQRIQETLAPLLPFPEALSSTIAEPSQVMNRQETTCPRCKRSAQAHWKHCVYCGQLLSAVCSRCGAPRAEVEGVRFCYECGNPLE